MSFSRTQRHTEGVWELDGRLVSCIHSWLGAEFEFAALAENMLAYSQLSSCRFSGIDFIRKLFDQSVAATWRIARGSQSACFGGLRS